MCDQIVVPGKPERSELGAQAQMQQGASTRGVDDYRLIELHHQPQPRTLAQASRIQVFAGDRHEGVPDRRSRVRRFGSHGVARARHDGMLAEVEIGGIAPTVSHGGV